MPTPLSQFATSLIYYQLDHVRHTRPVFGTASRSDVVLYPFSEEDTVWSWEHKTALTIQKDAALAAANAINRTSNTVVDGMCATHATIRWWPSLHYFLQGP
jgi:hypothetical protein